MRVPAFRTACRRRRVLAAGCSGPPALEPAQRRRAVRAATPSGPFVYHNLCVLAHSLLCHNPASEFLAALTLDEISIPQLTNDLLNRLYRQSQCISKLSLRQIRLLAQKAQYLIPTFIPTLNPTFFPYLICFTLGLRCPKNLVKHELNERSDVHVVFFNRPYRCIILRLMRPYDVLNWRAALPPRASPPARL